ncbi:hypothetical protein C0J52_12355 [Blattella germanica]|nr:hypothetical protein C0J52_12355 [Blattella germanica]
MADHSKSSLGLLSAYLSDESSDEEIPGPKVSTKRQASKEWPNQNQNKRRSSEENTLPVPSALISMYPTPNDIKVNNPLEHGDEPGPAVKSFVDVVLECSKSTVSLKPSEECHVSLTRTVVLRHHWIDSFIESVRECFRDFPSFSLGFNTVKVYCNDEKTRTFIGLTVAEGHKSLTASVNILNKCLADFKLPPFYKEASFHMSVAWCVGNYVEQIEKNVLPQLQIAFQHFMYAQHDQWMMNVNQLHCKTGNKVFSFQLAT